MTNTQDQESPIEVAAGSILATLTVLIFLGCGIFLLYLGITTYQEVSDPGLIFLSIISVLVGIFHGSVGIRLTILGLFGK